MIDDSIRMQSRALCLLVFTVSQKLYRIVDELPYLGQLLQDVDPHRLVLCCISEGFTQAGPVCPAYHCWSLITRSAREEPSRSDALCISRAYIKWWAQTDWRGLHNSTHLKKLVQCCWFARLTRRKNLLNERGSCDVV